MPAKLPQILNSFFIPSCLIWGLYLYLQASHLPCGGQVPPLPTALTLTRFLLV